MNNSFKLLVEDYLSNSGKSLDECLDMYCKFFRSDQYNDEIKAEVALIGNHQSRLNDIHQQRQSAQQAIKALAAAKLRNKKYYNFDEILVDVTNLLKDVKYIASLTIYDISVRISASCDTCCLPTKVYLNAGAYVGAQNLLGKKYVKTKMDISSFTTYVGELSAVHIENLLCIYKKVLIKHNVKANITFEKQEYKGCSFRRNMLAYQIFIEKRATVESQIMLTI